MARANLWTWASLVPGCRVWFQRMLRPQGDKLLECVALDLGSEITPDGLGEVDKEKPAGTAAPLWPGQIIDRLLHDATGQGHEAVSVQFVGRDSRAPGDRGILGHRPDDKTQSRNRSIDEKKLMSQAVKET